jgi:hypothetical protein
MKLSPRWIRDFVNLPVDDRRLADDLTGVGIAVEGISGSGADTVFEMEIGTNRPDAMNHYGVAREAAAIFDLPLKPIEPKLPPAKGKAEFSIKVEEPQLCPRFSARPTKLHIGCSRSTSGPSATLSTPLITFCGKWANLRTFLTWICWKANG